MFFQFWNRLDSCYYFNRWYSDNLFKGIKFRGKYLGQINNNQKGINIVRFIYKYRKNKKEKKKEGEEEEVQEKKKKKKIRRRE